MTPHLFIGLCRALWLTPLVIATTVMTGRAGLLDEPPAPRESGKRSEPRAKLRVVGGRDVCKPANRERIERWAKGL